MIHRGVVAAVLLMVISCLSLVSAEAYFVDTPHNESNGIYCYMCHNNSAWYWGDPHNNTDDIDVTIKNHICLSCHGQSPDTGDPWVREAPTKGLHASSNRGGCGGPDYGIWSTECIDCHDPHIQPQLEWSNTDPASFWLAEGFLDYTFGENPNFNSGDPDGQGYGATTFGVSFITGQAGWTDPMNWSQKGGYMDPSRAQDNSRGLIFVPNKAAPTENFEILNAVLISPGNYRLKVKGQITSLQEFVTFGVFYGSSIKSEIINPTDLFPKSVKFFQPDRVPGTYGGWVDLTPATTEPKGICQVCHTSVIYWKFVPGPPGPLHNEDTNCSDCHDIFGAASGASCGHTAFIVNYYNDILYSPPVDCSVCHDPSDPVTLHATADNTANGGGVGCEACHTVGQTMLNADVAGRLGVTSAFGDDGAWPYDCSACHPTKPEEVYIGVHPAGGPQDFIWDGDCADCHLTGTEPVISVVHGNVCDTCHNGIPNRDNEKIGDPANGVDGDATLADGTAAAGTWSTVGCTTCHAVATPAAIHHDTIPAQAGACTINCHNVAGHTGDHQSLVVDIAPCDNCHTATAPVDANNVPLDSSSPTGDMVHDSCIDCHDTASPIMALNAPNGSAAAMPAGGVGSNNGGGTCADCHTGYFDNHIHGHTLGANILLTPTTSDCDGCHTATSTPFTGAGQVHSGSGCMTCHSASTGALIGSAAGNDGATECISCHSAYFNGHTVHTASGGHTILRRAGDLDGGSGCEVCHGVGGTANPTKFTNAWHDGSNNDIFALHNTSCGLCHNSTRTTGTTGAGVQDIIANGISVGCLDCHNPAHAPGPSIVEFVGAPYTVNEKDGVATIYLNRSGDLTDPISVNYTISDGTATAGSDYETTIFSGVGWDYDLGGTIYFTIPIIFDGVSELDETFTITLTGGSNIDFPSGNQTTVTILDNDHTVVFDPGTDLYIGMPCSDCHTNEVENWNNILTRHDNYDLNGPSSCDTCHNAIRDTSTSGLFSVGLTIPDIINNGGSVKCLDCHIDEGGGGTGH